MRSIWKGHIQFSLVTIPIQVFSAVNRTSNVSFRQIHKEDNGAVGYKKYCKTCDDILEKDDIVKGYEYEVDQYAIFESEDLDKIKLKSTRSVAIEAFVDINEVSPARFEDVYFIGPEGDIAQNTFALFSQTLRKTGKAGIGRIILRDKEDVVLLTVPKKGPGLIMYKLRFDYELRDIKNVPDLHKGEIDKAQVELAEQLVASLTMPFEDVDFTDRYKDALQELVDQKVAGKEIVSIDEEDDDKPVVNIMDALKKSIEDAKKKTA